MELKTENFYRIVAPRPTVLISTTDGVNSNAAPFSFVMPVSVKPALIAFSCGHGKDTLANIRKTKEFVVNVPSSEILDAVWVCSKKFPNDVNEIIKSGLTERKSKKIKPPSIDECIAWFECKLEFEKDMGDHVLIVGEVLNVEVIDEISKDEGFDVLERVLMHLTGRDFTVSGKILNPKIE